MSNVPLDCAWIFPLTDATDGTPVAVRVAEICLIGQVPATPAATKSRSLFLGDSEPVTTPGTAAYTVLRLTNGDSVRITESQEEVMDRLGRAIEGLNI